MNGHRFVLLVFTSDEGLNDAAVSFAASKEHLCPVTQAEFGVLLQKVGKPKIRIAAFGNTARGNSEAGFIGVPFLDTDGSVKVEENWTRGNTGDQWNGSWKFAFVPAS